MERDEFLAGYRKYRDQALEMLAKANAAGDRSEVDDVRKRIELLDRAAALGPDDDGVVAAPAPYGDRTRSGRPEAQWAFEADGFVVVRAADGE